MKGKAIIVLRLILTAILLGYAYQETGIATTIILALGAISHELTAAYLRRANTALASFGKAIGEARKDQDR